MASENHEYTGFQIQVNHRDAIQLRLIGKRTPYGGALAPIPFDTGEIHVTGRLHPYLQDTEEADIHVHNGAGGTGIELVSDGTDGLAIATIPFSMVEDFYLTDTVMYVRCFWVDPDGEPHTFMTGTLVFNP